MFLSKQIRSNLFGVGGLGFELEGRGRRCGWGGWRGSFGFGLCGLGIRRTGSEFLLWQVRDQSRSHGDQAQWGFGVWTLRFSRPSHASATCETSHLVRPPSFPTKAGKPRLRHLWNHTPHANTTPLPLSLAKLGMFFLCVYEFGLFFIFLDLSVVDYSVFIDLVWIWVLWIFCVYKFRDWIMLQ